MDGKGSGVELWLYRFAGCTGNHKQTMILPFELLQSHEECQRWEGCRDDTVSPLQLPFLNTQPYPYIEYSEKLSPDGS